MDWEVFLIVLTVGALGGGIKSIVDNQNHIVLPGHRPHRMPLTEEDEVDGYPLGIVGDMLVGMAAAAGYWALSKASEIDLFVYGIALICGFSGVHVIRRLRQLHIGQQEQEQAQDDLEALAQRVTRFLQVGRQHGVRPTPPPATVTEESIELDESAETAHNSTHLEDEEEDQHDIQADQPSPSQQSGQQE